MSQRHIYEPEAGNGYLIIIIWYDLLSIQKQLKFKYPRVFSQGAYFRDDYKMFYFFFDSNA